MTAHGRKGRKYIRTSVPEPEEGDPGQAFTHAKDVCYRAQVDAEEVGSGNADRAEEEANPYHEYDEGDGLGT